MGNLADFSSQGYQVERELGQNRAGGRVTYLATSAKTQQHVVIKQFQFAQSGTSWSDYDAYEQEIQLLRCLNHPSIPQYLDSFETPSGFCLVQEYKPASSLSASRHFTPQEVKRIAVSLLEVLVYLQQQNPPIIHRDIKPENILVDEQLKVYLVDFGLARIGGGEVAASSTVKGTLGFMPPEQVFNRQLTQASDLYSLGATLICLLTQTKSTEIGNLVDEAFRINFKPRVRHLNPQFSGWLEKMTAPNCKNRYPNAVTALEALKPIDVVRRATIPKILLRPTKQSVLAAVALLTLSFVTLNTVTRLFQEHQITQLRKQHLRQLLKTKQCRGCDLSGANLAGASLNGADLSEAKLIKANLKGAELRNAKLNQANLAGVSLSSADLRGASLAEVQSSWSDCADFKDANLSQANLSKANLGCASLYNANLSSAELGSADLTGVDLRHGNLRGATLKLVRLQTANLGSASLIDANLSGADLGGANLRSANLSSANLNDAALVGASLYGANLSGANLTDANLSHANLSTANLSEVNLGGATLIGVNLESADLSFAKMSSSNLSRANLKFANLSYATLTQSNLRGANLNQVNLSQANLSQANLEYADLSYANLKQTNLSRANLNQTKLHQTDLTNTRMPDGSIHK
ncbi:pentapeptide repeat-containing protein [Coleofasciculus sp. FACHB-1120]|uniref:pentapeptide repeat-containing protein n=1 Tax=Coleofasciculus sp. FACHB-1120 TaxID=2692783 RepID=UPI0016883F9B|nr:pentapeptide repeat-containing protein [Coleofasciculus sp. FACHB-1120]MBD2744094.1 pentapeptide repeat-containing protein [Coleofasciculus sp. FACHB-1120]